MTNELKDAHTRRSSPESRHKLPTARQQDNKRNKQTSHPLFMPPSHTFYPPCPPPPHLSSEGMSPLGLAVQQPDPCMAGCAAPAADCPSNTSRETFSQEDHACCPFDLASSSCCSTQQHFVHVSSPHSVLRHQKKQKKKKRKDRKKNPVCK